MDNKRTFSKEEISKILSKASKIQTRKDLYGEEQGLTEEELIHIAEEAGIDKDTLFEAIQSSDVPELDTAFNWITASSKIQDIHFIKGEITEEIWEEVVQDIREVTGGIGKINKTGKSFEWEQRLKKIGYRHISVIPQKGHTKIQFVSNWRGLKTISGFLSFFWGCVFTGIFLIGTNFPEPVYYIVLLLGGFGAVGVGRFYLRHYFEKQKSMFRKIIKSIGKRLSIPQEPAITIEKKNISGEKTSASSSAPRRERS